MVHGAWCMVHGACRTCEQKMRALEPIALADMAAHIGRIITGSGVGIDAFGSPICARTPPPSAQRASRGLRAPLPHSSMMGV
jgi:hypothetical protein